MRALSLDMFITSLQEAIENGSTVSCVVWDSTESGIIHTHGSECIHTCKNTHSAVLSIYLQSHKRAHTRLVLCGLPGDVR